MTDHHDDEGDAIPERSERADSGGHVTDSGRHVNRNIVPRGTMADPPDGGAGAGAARPASDSEDFDDDTPVRPPPRGVFGSMVPPGQPRDVFEAITPRRTQPRGVYPEETEAAARAREASPSAAAPEAPVRTSERWPRLVLPDPEAAPTPPREASNPGIRVDGRRPTAEPRRANTEPGHVEPRRRPTTPPPALPALRAPEPSDSDEVTPIRRAPTERGIHESRESGAIRASASGTTIAVPASLDRLLRVGAVLAVFGLGAAGLAQPTSVLRGGIAWLAFLFFVLIGWGAIVTRITRTRDPDAGQCAALGAGGYLAVAGVAIAAGGMTRPVVLALICLGFVGFAWREATAPIALWQRIREGLAFLRANPAIGVLVIVLALLACVRLLGAVAALDRNPWDDDLAYTPLVKRLLDAGNLIEPFSFRRLGAYGGQTALEALSAARGTLANVHLIDRGLGLGVALLVMLGHARERRTQALWLALIALVILVLPETAINTASYWTGVAGFLALYRCVARGEWSLAGLVAGATATLRQNFLAVVAVFVLSALLSRLFAVARAMPFREAWREERRAWATVIGVALAVLVPWCIAAQLSSHTFLFPVFDGNWNHELSLRPGVTTWSQELAFLVTSCIDTAPIAVIPILAIAAAFLTDRRPGRPLVSLVIASVAGVLLLVHGLLGSEAFHLWRYAFGFATALAIVLALELGGDHDERVELAPLGRWLVLAALVLQILLGRAALPKQAIALFDDLREAAAIDRRGDPSALAEQRRYTAMQAAIPAGERLVVMVDDPALLDYRRNPIANLDTPGLASPGSQLPAFRGAEALRGYLVEHGYRYAAVVRSERSRYFFRRPFWVWRLFNDAELFQIMSAYTIDAIDGFAELATTTRLAYDSDGLVVLDLANPLRDASRRAATGDEPTRRTAWTRELADREGLHDAWSLTTRADLRFEDGTGALRFVDESIDDPRWYEVTHATREPARRGKAILPILRRAHLRVRGAGDMRLALRAAIALNTVYTHPRLDISLDGALLTSAVADATGRYEVSLVVPGERLARGWHDLYLVFSSYAEPDKDVHDLRIARLEAVEWSAP